MQGMSAYNWMRGTFQGEESVCGTDVYEQCRRKVGRIFVRSKSLAGIEMDKSGIQGYEEIAEEGRKKKYEDVWHKDGICQKRL